MARTNVPVPGIKTHEGGTAKRINEELRLRRSVMACLLWEDTFYESGVEIAKRIQSLVPLVKAPVVRDMAIEARTGMKLRHVPLLLAREMARHASHKPLVASTLSQVIQRADELAEFVAIYWKEKRQPLSAQVKKGLAIAFTKFSAYDLAKYNRLDAQVKLRDVLFLCHAKPKTEEQIQIWKQLVDNTLPTPDTWEVALSSGADKKLTWERLLAERKLGALAFLRNLRNMQQANVSRSLMKDYFTDMKVDRVLPYRFIAAARFAPDLEPELEQTMFKAVAPLERLKGRTVLLIDTSGSMDDHLSERSDLTRLDAACGLAILARELCEDVTVYTFNTTIRKVPPRRGFALRDAIGQPNGGTYLEQAVNHINRQEPYDRFIVITDEQAHDSTPNPVSSANGYVINVAAYKNGVGYGAWNHIDGWSEAVLSYIQKLEQLD